MLPPNLRDRDATVYSMEAFPAVANLDDGESMGEGHLWILERVEGVPLRFMLQDDGRLVFGDENRRLDPRSAPPAISPAIDAVQSGFDRGALRQAVADVSAVTFYGIATCQHRIEYDWEALPDFVGYDVLSTTRDGLLTPDASNAIFERLGLTPAPALEREVRADAVSPDRYSFPESRWADTTVAGVRLADKHGWRGRLDNPDLPSEPTASFADAEAAARALVTDDHRSAFEAGETVDRLRDRLAREHRAELSIAGIDPDSKAFRSAVARALQGA